MKANGVRQAVTTVDTPSINLNFIDLAGPTNLSHQKSLFTYDGNCGYFGGENSKTGSPGSHELPGPAGNQSAAASQDRSGSTCDIRSHLKGTVHSRDGSQHFH